MRISIWPQNKLEVVCKIPIKMFSNIRIKSYPLPGLFAKAHTSLKFPTREELKEGSEVAAVLAFIFSPASLQASSTLKV